MEGSDPTAAKCMDAVHAVAALSCKLCASPSSTNVAGSSEAALLAGSGAQACWACNPGGAVYCSRVCMEADAPHHAPTCIAIVELWGSGRRS